MTLYKTFLRSQIQEGMTKEFHHFTDGWKNVAFIGSWNYAPWTTGKLTVFDKSSNIPSIQEYVKTCKADIRNNILEAQTQGKTIIIGVTNGHQNLAALCLYELGFRGGGWCGTNRYPDRDIQLWWKEIGTDDAGIKKLADKYLKKLKCGKPKEENFNLLVNGKDQIIEGCSFYGFPTVCTAKVLAGLENLKDEKEIRHVLLSAMSKVWNTSEGFLTVCTKESQKEATQVLTDLNFESSRWIPGYDGERVKVWWFAVQESKWEGLHLDESKVRPSIIEHYSLISA